ncbi:hypothetical protein [Nostoc sphaeroides]|uniref:hypothetical protein n=1 Tax=Nostoc sphaeroides TaxID=446679 RepID=UPI002B400088|nr:hypothetical protein [Nostoc sphaeroides]
MNKPLSRRKKATSATSRDSTPPDDQDLEDISQQEDPGSATITVTAVEVPELTEQEQSDRLHLERKVERAVFEAGKALMELRDIAGFTVPPTALLRSIAKTGLDLSAVILTD